MEKYSDILRRIANQLDDEAVPWDERAANAAKALAKVERPLSMDGGLYVGEDQALIKEIDDLHKRITPMRAAVDAIFLQALDVIASETDQSIKDQVMAIMKGDGQNVDKNQ